MLYKIYKTYFSLLYVLLGSIVFAQELKTIEAKQAKDSDYFDYEDYEAPGKPIGELEFLKGCSWYCGGNVKSISASSELKGNKTIDYSAKNVHDFNKNTAWIEGKADDGIGEYLEYTFDFRDVVDYDGSLGITKILLANGYKKNKQTWENNGRVKQLKIYVNNRVYAVANLLNSFEIQTIDLGTIIFPTNSETKIKFEITAVYKGKKYKDTAISLLMFEGVGVHIKQEKNISFFENNPDYFFRDIDINKDGIADKIISSNPYQGDELYLFVNDNGLYVPALKTLNFSEDGGNIIRDIIAVNNGDEVFKINTFFPDRGFFEATHYIAYIDSHWVLKRTVYETSNWRESDAVYICDLEQDIPLSAFNDPDAKYNFKLFSEADRDQLCIIKQK